VRTLRTLRGQYRAAWRALCIAFGAFWLAVVLLILLIAVLKAVA
jgi:hypothetical protein